MAVQRKERLVLDDIESSGGFVEEGRIFSRAVFLTVQLKDRLKYSSAKHLDVGILVPAQRSGMGNVERLYGGSTQGYSYYADGLEVVVVDGREEVVVGDKNVKLSDWLEGNVVIPSFPEEIYASVLVGLDRVRVVMTTEETKVKDQVTAALFGGIGALNKVESWSQVQ